jgi:hypothetical protein
MAELLVRTRDKPLSGDPYVDRHRAMRGCVIAIMPDGHKWSERERTASHWRIVRLPGVSPHLLSQLTAPDLGYGDEEAEKLNRVARRWASRIDLPALAAKLADARVRADIETKPVRALAEILAVKIEAPVLRDTAVIGDKQDMARVIG